ncbi:MAG TPA: glycerophosphodiester phosphodiesterase [Acidimicrobiales bacterium]|nr:glycerophosphodiester phosphodiesterase [Acidimicrobiales bacterium]
MTERARRWPWRGRGARPALLAHRGGRGPWVENTLEAFAGALRLGADGVELDVRRSADGVLVVHHDPRVEGVGFVHEIPSAQLPPWVPTLSEALAACAGAAVNVEIKNSAGDPGHDPSESVVSEVLESLSECAAPGRGGPSELLLSSFSLATVGVLASCGTQVPYGLLVAPAASALEAAHEAASMGCSSLNPFHLQVSPSLVDRAHEMGLAVVTWTVDGPEQLRAVLAAGVDAIVSNDVSGALAVISGPGGLVRDSGPRGQSGP